MYKLELRFFFTRCVWPNAGHFHWLPYRKKNIYTYIRKYNIKICISFLCQKNRRDA